MMLSLVFRCDDMFPGYTKPLTPGQKASITSNKVHGTGLQTLQVLPRGVQVMVGEAVGLSRWRIRRSLEPCGARISLDT